MAEIARGLHVIVQLARTAEGETRVTEIAEVTPGERGAALKTIYTYKADGGSGRFTSTGHAPAWAEGAASAPAAPAAGSGVGSAFGSDGAVIVTVASDAARAATCAAKSGANTRTSPASMTRCSKATSSSVPQRGRRLDA